MLVANLAQSLHQLLGRDIEAAFALHRFDDDGRDPRGLDIRLEQPFDGVDRVFDRHTLMRDRERYMPYARNEGPELRLVGNDLASHRHGQQGAAMEAALE